MDTPEKPEGEKDEALGADDLNLIDPNLADEAKDEAEIWDEMEAEETGTAPKDENDTSETGDEDAELAAQGFTDENEGDSGAKVPDEENGSGGTSDEDGSQNNENDIWANAPPELKAAYEELAKKHEDLDHRMKSDDGRVAALSRQIDDLRAQLTKPPADEADGKDDGDKPSVQEALKELGEDYPEVAEVLERISGDLDAKVSRLSAAEESRHKAAQDQMAAHVEIEGNKVEEAHPGYVAFVKENVDAYLAWVDDQPKRIRDAAAANDGAIVDAAAAIEVIDGFKKHLGIEPAKAPANDPEPDPKLNDKRQRQLNGSASPRKPGGKAVVSGIPEDGDEEAIWNAMEEAEERERRASAA